MEDQYTLPNSRLNIFDFTSFLVLVLLIKKKKKKKALVVFLLPPTVLIRGLILSPAKVLVESDREIIIEYFLHI